MMLSATTSMELQYQYYDVESHMRYGGSGGSGGGNGEGEEVMEERIQEGVTHRCLAGE